MPVNPSPQPFTRGTLWQRMVARTESAIASGALHSIATTEEHLEQSGVAFIIRISTNLKRKQAAATPRQPSVHNPFLPFESELYVADLSPTHVALLNKFNVVDHHLLIITRVFEAQASWLTRDDFLGLAIAMAEVNGLGFYNGGQRAGASQPHKHLQLIPFPVPDAPSPLPIQTLTRTLQPGPDLQTLPVFTFQHGLLALDLDWSQPPEALAARLHSHYQTLGKGLSLAQTTPQSVVVPYNLLVTREWMLMVPRRQDAYSGISVNALGFAGSLFVRDRTQLQQLHTIGPMRLLEQVAMPN